MESQTETKSTERRLEPLGVGIDSLDIDVHEGAHDFPDIESQMKNTDGVQQFSVRFEDAVKHMSVNKYESEASMIREYVANMAATCLEAQERLGEEYTPTIHIAYYPESNRLIMEDNGMGMSQTEVENVGIQLGVSTNRYNSNRGGKYGIGLLSGLKGVGLKGAFFMHSRSRRTDEYVRGVWTSHGFKPEEKLPDKLEDGQYGTRFEFPLKAPEVDIRASIADVAKWSRIPVLYTEHSADGSLIEDDEFGGRSETPFADSYSGDKTKVVVENEAFRAVHSPEATNETILLDVPIERNADFDDSNYNLPFSSVDVVFKSEDEEIVSGPHEGMTRVGDGEYAQMDESRKEDYIPASQCAPNDVWTPSPAGDRDRFEQNPDFWEWLAEEVQATFEERLERITSEATESDDILSLRREDIAFIVDWVEYANRFRGEWGAGELRTELKKYDFDVDDETLYQLSRIGLKVDACERGRDPWSTRARTEKYVYECLIGTPDEADVWMAKHPSEKRANVVWDDHEGHVVVRVAEEDTMELFEEAFGWRRLNYVDEETLDEFDISEETRELCHQETKYRNPNAGKDAPERELTLHYAYTTNKAEGGYKDRTQKHTARYLRAYFEARREGYTPNRGKFKEDINNLVLFPSNTDEKLTDYVGALGHGKTRLANCTVKVYDYLKDLDRVHHIDDFVQQARELTLPTSEGKLTLPEARKKGKNLVLHLVPENLYPVLSGTPEVEYAAEWYEQESETGGYHKRRAYEDVVYTPVTEEVLGKVLPVIHHEDVYVATHETSCDLPSENCITRPDKDTELYAYARLYNWHTSPEYRILSQHDKAVGVGMKDVIDGFAELHEEGIRPPSERDTVEKEHYEHIVEVAKE